MKRILLLPVVLLLAAVFVMGGSMPILATSDAPENPDNTSGDVADTPGNINDMTDGLDAETERQIKQTLVDYLNGLDVSYVATKTVDCVVIQGYYGTYNGCVAAMIGDRDRVYTFATNVDIVAGIGFAYMTSHHIEAWKDGKLYSLREAFELGFLSGDDIADIQQKYIVSYSYSLNLTLSAEQENRIKDDWVNGYLGDTEPQHTVDAVEIKYYGTYNHFGAYDSLVALYISDNFHSYPALSNDKGLDIDGIVFYGNDAFGIRIWNDGRFIELRQAYEQGLLSRLDLVHIEYYYRTGN